jgi:photosystem II stability/assembly factor-like uncharacterized protein
MDEPTDGRRKLILTVRQLVLAAAIVMSLAGASYARGAAAQSSPTNITAIQVDPKRPNIVYASSTRSDTDISVVKSTDAGKTWSAADNGLPAARVDALALNARSPNILYAGTGIGVFKTTDGARTWKLASKGIDYDDNSRRYRLHEGSIWAIAIDPVHTSTVYAAGRGGVWKTTTGGATWKRVLRYRTLQLAVDPRRPTTVYASASKGPHSIYKTVDGGVRWRGIGPPTLRDGFFGHPIVVDRRAPGTVYAGGSRGLFASANQGRTWTKLLAVQGAFGIGAIALDPSRAKVLYVGTTTRGLMKSVDGGQTWSEPRLDGRSVGPIAIAPTRPQTIYADVWWETAPQEWTEGMFMSTDGGATWHRLP